MLVCLKRFLIYIFPPLFLTALIYWPLYKKINFDDSESNVDYEIKKVEIPIPEEILGFLNVPINRKQLCLINRNGVYLIHTDNDLFTTPDISRTQEAKERNAGAMAIQLYYSDGQEKFENYKRVGEWGCQTLENKRRQHFASSTILYSHMSVLNTSELDLGEFGKIVLGRTVGNSFVDTRRSWAFIVPRWHFLLVSVALFLYGWYQFLDSNIPRKFANLCEGAARKAKRLISFLANIKI